MAVEAGARIKDAITFVIAAFKSGQVLDLVSASLKLGFAVAINSLINGFRAAVSFLSYKDLQKENNRLMESGGAGVADSAAQAARKAGEFGFTDTIDTTGLRDNMNKVVRSIQDSMPKPEEVKQAAKVATKTGDTGKTISQQASRLDPIVTSLGKVGGGGYSTGTLDAQRENNRLTGQTNDLLKDLNKTVGKLGGTKQAAFG